MANNTNKFKEKFALGTKLHMTQVFDEAGVVHGVTVIEVEPSVVVQTKTKEKDGYKAVQVGYGKKSAKNINKAVTGHIKGLGLFRWLKEYRVAPDATLPEVGSHVAPVELFEVGQVVEVSGITKGKGFQGVVKRHGFKGGRRSHGQKHSEREPGSIGGGGRDGGRVAKGMRMAGRMGGDRVTVRNLKIVAVDKEANQIMIEGAVPGRRGTLIEIKA